MRKPLAPLVLSLSLCAAALAALALPIANAQTAAPTARKPAIVRTQADDRNEERNDERLGRGFREHRPMRAGLCNDVYARAAGMMAFTEAKLNLTPAQATAFERWKSVRLAAAKRRSDSCAARPARMEKAARATPVERMAREEERLKQRLAQVEAERPELEALYNALTPEQRLVLASNRHNGMRRGGMMRARMMMRGPGMSRPDLAPPAPQQP